MFDKKKENTKTKNYPFLPRITKSKQPLINKYATISPHSGHQKEEPIQIQILKRKKKYTEDET